MMIPTCRRASKPDAGLYDRLLCITKSPVKKGRRGSGRQDAEPGCKLRLVLARGPGGVAHQAFEHGKVVKEFAPAGPGQAAAGVWPVAFIALGDLDEARLLQHLQVPAQIAVGQA